MPFMPIDDMPMLFAVEQADDYQIVCWNHYLRRALFNEELGVIKAIARRYDSLSEGVRTPLVARARKEFER
jgi:hypothetical protein